MTERDNPFQRRLRTLARVLMVVITLACHIAAGGLSAQAEAPAGQTAAVMALSVMCQSAKHPARNNTPTHHRHLVDPAVAAAALAFAHPAALPQTAAVLPPPAAVAVLRRTTPPAARAPPSRHATAVSPRGPPALS